MEKEELEKKEKTLNESIISIRVALQKLKLKKTGHNSYSNFDYYQLEDFLPSLNELMLQENVNDLFTIEEDESYQVSAKLILIKGDEQQVYKIPFTQFDTPLNWKYNKTTQENEQVKSMQDVQYLGALNTYYKRYLYINAWGITDGEIIDGMDNTSEPVKQKQPKEEPNILKKADEEINLKLTQEFNDALNETGTDLDDILNYYNKEKKQNFTLDDMTEAQKKEAITIMRKKAKK